MDWQRLEKSGMLYSKYSLRVSSIELMIKQMPSLFRGGICLLFKIK